MNLPTSLDFKMTSSESGFKPNLPTSLTFEMALFGFGAPYCTAFVTFYLPTYLPPIFDVSNFFFVWKRYTKTKIVYQNFITLAAFFLVEKQQPQGERKKERRKKFRSRRWGSSFPDLRTQDPPLSPPSM